jgi:hypothetical protein
MLIVLVKSDMSYLKPANFLNWNLAVRMRESR